MKMMADVFKRISKEAHESLVKTAADSVAYVAMGGGMMVDLARKYGVSAADVEVILARVSDDLIRKIKRVKQPAMATH